MVLRIVYGKMATFQRACLAPRAASLLSCVFLVLSFSCPARRLLCPRQPTSTVEFHETVQSSTAFSPPQAPKHSSSPLAASPSKAPQSTATRTGCTRTPARCVLACILVCPLAFMTALSLHLSSRRLCLLPSSIPQSLLPSLPPSFLFEDPSEHRAADLHPSQSQVTTSDRACDHARKSTLEELEDLHLRVDTREYECPRPVFTSGERSKGEMPASACIYSCLPQTNKEQDSLRLQGEGHLCGPQVQPCEPD